MRSGKMVSEKHGQKQSKNSKTARSVRAGHTPSTQKSKPASRQRKVTKQLNANLWLERISDGIVVFDKEMNYIYVNEQGGALLGRKPEDLIGKNYWEEYPEAKDTPFANAYVHALETQTPITFEDYYAPWDRWFENRIYPMEEGILIFYSEVTERKHVERQIAQMSRLYATLSQVNQTIVRVKDRKELYEAICNVAVKFGKFSLAWIGLLDETSGEVKPVAVNGLDITKWPFPTINIHRGDLKGGLIASALRTSKVVTSNDIQVGRRLKNLYDQVQEYAYHASAAVPFRIRDKTIGVLCLTSAEKKLFESEEEIHLLDEMGLDISFALDTLENEAERRQAEETLRASEARYRELFENMQEGSALEEIILDDQGRAVDFRFLNVNAAYERHTGMKPQEVLGRTIREILPTVDPRQIENYGKVALTGEPQVIEYYSKAFQRYFRVRAFSPQRGRFATIFEDITDRKQAELALQESEERLRLSTELANVAVWEYDFNSNSMSRSRNHDRLYGLDWQARWDINTFLNATHPDDRTYSNEIIQKSVAPGGPDRYKFDFRVVYPNGSVHWLAVIGQVVERDSNGQGTLVRGSLIDVTGRKQVETEREEWLNVIEVSLNEIYMFDPDTLKFQYVNRGAIRNLGYSLEQLKAMTPLDLKPEFTAASFRELIAPMLQHEQEKLIFPTVHRRSDGSLYPVEVYLQLVENPDRRVFLAVILDVTERRQAEEALQIAERDYRSIFENASIGIFRSTPDGRFLKVNSTMAAIFGYATPEEMIHSITDITKQLYLETSSREHFQSLVRETGEALNLENQNFRKDGSIIWTSTSAHAVRDETGKILYYEGFASDITKSKQAEEALRESEESLVIAQAMAKLGSWTWDPHTNSITSASDELLHILSLEREEVTLENFANVIHPDDLGWVMPYLDLGAQGQEYDIEHRLKLRDGTIKWIHTIGKPQLDDAGRVVKLFGTTQDITERKYAEKQILQLTRLYATLSQVNQTIVRVKNQQELFDNICEVAVQFGEFRLAWIGILDDESGEVIRTAQAGESIGYVKDLKINIHDPKLNNGPTARAFRFGTAQIIDDIKTNDLMTPWRENAGKYKFRSSAALPLRLNGRVIGTLNLYSAEPDFFTQPEQRLLDEMGLDISFALDKIQTTEEHNQAVEAMQQSEALYRSVFSVLSEGLVVQNTDDKIQVANDAAARILGLTVDQLLGRDSYDPRWMATHEDGTPFRPEDHPSMVTMRTGQPVDNAIMKVNIGDGFRAVISINSRPIHDEQGEVSGVVVSFSDITERRRAEVRIQQQLRRMSALHMIDIAITSSFDLKTTFNIVLQETMSQLNVDACAILLFNPQTQMIEYAASRGFYSSATRHTKLRVSEGYAGRVVLERGTIHITDLMSTNSQLSTSLRLANESFSDYYGIPLIAKGEVKGVLELYHRSSIRPDPNWLSFLETLSTQTAIAIDNAQLFGSLQRSKHELEIAYDATIQGWSHALDLRDKETEGHTQRVTDLTLKLAQAMGLMDDDLVHIRRGALLHDIGKMGVPDNILLKAGSLTDKEWEQMHKHPDFAYEMLSEIRYLRPALDIPYCHHEKWDGTGYPRGLKGEEIPLAARIFAVADVWDALMSDRTYRKAWSKEEVKEYVKEQSGKYFDPKVVDVFLNLIVQ